MKSVPQNTKPAPSLKSDKAEEEEKKTDPKLKYSVMDCNIPNKTEPTLVLTHGLPEMLVEMSKDDRRLTSAEKKKKWLKSYNLSEEQHAKISPLFNFATSALEEEIGKNLAPSLANSLRSLIDQEVHVDFPLFKLFDVLFNHSSKNNSESRIVIESVEQAQELVDSLNFTVHDAILGRLWSINSLKLTIANLMGAQFKSKGQQKFVQAVMKDNLDKQPEKGMLANLPSSLGKFAKSSNALRKGNTVSYGSNKSEIDKISGGMNLKRGADVSLVSSSLAKHPKMMNISYNKQGRVQSISKSKFSSFSSFPIVILSSMGFDLTVLSKTNVTSTVGRLGTCLQNWKIITSNSFVLKVLSEGYKIQFTDHVKVWKKLYLML